MEVVNGFFVMTAAGVFLAWFLFSFGRLMVTVIAEAFKSQGQF